MRSTYGVSREIGFWSGGLTIAISSEAQGKAGSRISLWGTRLHCFSKFQENKGKCNDNPNVAHEMELNIKKDDILIVGTDGMLDNMNESDIEEIVQRAIDHKLKADELARKIGNVALFNSLDRFADTPFARASKRKGGKVGDITVIVAYFQ
ncbi:hypothetical protein BC332_26229 [Capsicum chinense]|nr:hypothetical protein BC332_26229 [Capsicum chinense]